MISSCIDNMYKANSNTSCNMKHLRHRGAVVVEFALLLIPLLMIVTGIVEFGRSFWYYDALAKGTRDGARFLSLSRASELVALDATLKQQAKDMVVSSVSAAKVPNFSADYVEVDCTPNADCIAPEYITVRIDAYPLKIGGWIPVIVPAPSGSSSWSGTLSPYSTLRYMR